MTTLRKIILAVVLMASCASCTNSKEPKVIASEEWENILGDQMITATFDDGMKLKFKVLPASEVALNFYDEIPATGQVTIPSEITSNGNTYRVVRIGHSAFFGCDDMTTITIPNSVTGIGDYAFEDCTGLTSITIPKSVTDVGESIFLDCTGLTNVNIPNGVTTIWDGTFDGCIGLTTITIPNSVTSIGEYAFNDCTGLTSITIPSSVTSIGEKAFRGCTGLASITIPSSLTSFDKAFADCENLASITFQKGTTSICDGACANCTGLTSVTIPNTVTRIGDWAFAGCTNLASISIPNSVTSIGEGAFSVCTGLTSILIPESVTSIGGVAFAGCTGLTSVTIPQNVTSIEEGVFGACTNLTNIVVADGNSKYDSRDNCNAIIETASNTLIAACNNSTIPNGVTRIGENAFSGCTGLTSISIPNSVTSIGGYAFAYCSGLTSVVIPYGVTSIGEGSFSACTNLTSVTIPNSVTTIGEKAFAESNSLASVTIPNSVTSIGRDAFWRSCVMPSCNVVYETDGNALSYQGESYSSPSQPVSTSESQKVYSNAYNGNQVVVIDGSELRLRLGPSTSYDTFKWPDGTNCHPNVGDKFKYFGESGDFYKIDFNGNEVWVSKQYSHIESASLLFDLLGKDARNYDFTENDLATLSAKDLTYLRNSVYAKHGYVFKSQELNDYFSQFAWYHPDSSVTDAVLNNTEKTNVEFIKNYQRQNGKTYIPQ